MKRVLLAFTVAATTLLLQGCVGRAISEGAEKVLGPTGIALQMEPKWPEKEQTYLAAYKSFHLVTPIRSEFPDTPSSFFSYFPTKFEEQLASKGLPGQTGGKTLLIQVTILAYQPSTTFEQALGPTEEVVARVEFVDKDTGKLVGKAICIGRTYQSVGTGSKWKAWGLSRAIVNKWIDPYYPKEGRREVKEETAPPKEE
jgi:hypothetical protein